MLIFVSQWIIKTNGWNLQCMIKVVKLFSYCRNFGGYLPLPLGFYMYKIVKSLNVFFSETAWTAFTRFTWSLLSKGCRQFVQMILPNWTRWLPCPYMIEYLIIFFSRGKKALRLNFGTQHQGLKVYLVCWNDDTRMILDLFLWYGQICVLVAVAILEEVASQLAFFINL